MSSAAVCMEETQSFKGRGEWAGTQKSEKEKLYQKKRGGTEELGPMKSAWFCLVNWCLSKLGSSSPETTGLLSSGVLGGTNSKFFQQPCFLRHFKAVVLVGGGRVILGMWPWLLETMLLFCSSVQAKERMRRHWQQFNQKESFFF